MSRTIGLMLAGSLLLPGTLPAMAADFTFEVPVELSTVPADVTQAYIYCTALRYSNTSNLLSDPRPQISLTVGRPIPLSGGGYRGTVRVEADAQPGRRPNEANGYECHLAFMTARDRDIALTGNRLTEFFPAAAGTTPVLSVRALFPAR
jgi:hypothetical protein